MTTAEHAPLAAPPAFTLVCFAVKEEAAPFRRLTRSTPAVRTLVTGMGRQNAESAIRAILAAETPELVLSSGFAGGLREDLATGAIVYETVGQPGLEIALRSAGALRGAFHCADRIATTVADKRLLRDTTNADAVEMESGWMRPICTERHIPFATVRAILDTATEPLPLDFNQLLNARLELSFAKLALTLARSPSAISALLRFNQRVRATSQALGTTLCNILRLLGAA